MKQLIKQINNTSLDVREITKTLEQREFDRALQFVKECDIYQCKALIDALADKVSDFLGSADELEDLSFDILNEIVAREDAENTPICPNCNGSGEGQYDGTRCRSCGGSGTVKHSEDE